MLSVVGEALVDLVDQGDHVTFTAHPGGSPLNVAVGLAKLGHPTALLARLADDAFGRVLRGHAASNGVDLSAAAAAAEPTTLAVVSLDDHGRASYDFYIDGTADWQWTADELSAVPASTTLLHTGSLAAWTAPGAELIHAQVLRTARAGALISYDPNVRPRLLATPERARALIERSVAAAHVVKASDEDLAWLYPERDAHLVAEDWLGLGARLVIVTHGPQGAAAYRAGRTAVTRPAPPITLVDTVGAGDAFMSGLLGALSDAGVTTATLDGLDDDQLAGIVDEAVLVAALTCERAGANPPTRAELAQRQVRSGSASQ